MNSLGKWAVVIRSGNACDRPFRYFSNSWWRRRYNVDQRRLRRMNADSPIAHQCLIDRHAPGHRHFAASCTGARIPRSAASRSV